MPCHQDVLYISPRPLPEIYVFSSVPDLGSLSLNVSGSDLYCAQHWVCVLPWDRLQTTISNLSSSSCCRLPTDAACWAWAAAGHGWDLWRAAFRSAKENNGLSLCWCHSTQTACSDWSVVCDCHCAASATGHIMAPFFILHSITYSWPPPLGCCTWWCGCQALQGPENWIIPWMSFAHVV